MRNPFIPLHRITSNEKIIRKIYIIFLCTYNKKKLKNIFTYSLAYPIHYMKMKIEWKWICWCYDDEVQSAHSYIYMYKQMNGKKLFIPNFHALHKMGEWFSCYFLNLISPLCNILESELLLLFYCCWKLHTFISLEICMLSGKFKLILCIHFLCVSPPPGIAKHRDASQVFMHHPPQTYKQTNNNTIPPWMPLNVLQIYKNPLC